MTMHVETHYEQKESNDQQFWGMMSEQGMSGMGADGVGVSDGGSRFFSGFWSTSRKNPDLYCTIMIPSE